MYNAGVDLLGLSQNISGMKYANGYHNAVGDTPQVFSHIMADYYGVWPWRAEKVGFKTNGPHGLYTGDSVVINITNANSDATKQALTGVFNITIATDDEFRIPVDWNDAMSAAGTWQLSSKGCLLGYHKDINGSCVADSTVAECASAGQVLKNGVCESCLTNFHPENNACVINKLTCQPNYHETPNGCVADTPLPLTCPVGQERDTDGNCVATGGKTFPTWAIYVGIAAVVGIGIYFTVKNFKHHKELPTA